MEIRKVTDPSFGVYGKVLKGYGFDRLLKEMGHTPVPDDRRHLCGVRGGNWKDCLWRQKLKETGIWKACPSRSAIAMAIIIS